MMCSSGVGFFEYILFGKEIKCVIFFSGNKKIRVKTDELLYVHSKS